MWNRTNDRRWNFRQFVLCVDNARKKHRIWNESKPAIHTHTRTHFLCRIICRRCCCCWLPFRPINYIRPTRIRRIFLGKLLCATNFFSSHLFLFAYCPSLWSLSVPIHCFVWYSCGVRLPTSVEVSLKYTTLSLIAQVINKTACYWQKCQMTMGEMQEKSTRIRKFFLSYIVNKMQCGMSITISFQWNFVFGLAWLLVGFSLRVIYPQNEFATPFVYLIFVGMSVFVRVFVCVRRLLFNPATLHLYVGW